jgi:hypothetical protein
VDSAETKSRSVRTSQLDELGDCRAPEGSRPWALFIRNKLNSLLHDAEFASDLARDYFNKLRDSEGWRQLDDSKGGKFYSFEGFCVHRKPFGLGYDVGHIERIIREREEKEVSDMAREAKEKPLRNADDKPGRPKKEENGSSGNINQVDRARGGNNREYVLKRLARDNPELLSRVESGEMSPRAAGIKAGFIKVKSALDQLRHWWKKASHREREQFLKESA